MADTQMPAQVRSRAVLLTVPAYTAADLLRRDCPDASAALKSLDYPPVAAVTLAYPMSALRQDRLDEARKLPGESAVPASLAGGLCLGRMPVELHPCRVVCIVCALVGCHCLSSGTGCGDVFSGKRSRVGLQLDVHLTRKPQARPARPLGCMQLLVNHR